MIKTWASAKAKSSYKKIIVFFAHITYHVASQSPQGLPRKIFCSHTLIVAGWNSEDVQDIIVTFRRMWQCKESGSTRMIDLNLMNKFWSYIKTFFTKASGPKTNNLFKKVSWKFSISHNFYGDLTMVSSGDKKKSHYSWPVAKGACIKIVEVGY